MISKLNIYLWNKRSQQAHDANSTKVNNKLKYKIIKS